MNSNPANEIATNLQLFEDTPVTDIHQFSADCLIRDSKELIDRLQALPVKYRIEAINELRASIHTHSPFSAEPVDCVRWVPADSVYANDYNPNSVAPPEMKLLETSILEDGYTQPIVVWNHDGKNEVIDGFHRHRVGKESKPVNQRVMAYLPVVVINDGRVDLGDRMASTIRHNRARGKHKVEAMSDIVVELKRRNWSDEKIAKNLGMEPDEILRLTQISGLAEMFADSEFSRSWDVEGEITEADFEEISDDDESLVDLVDVARTVNTSDEARIFHTYEKWECYKAGFYSSTKDGMSKDDCEKEYKKLLTNIPAFEAALNGVITEWKNSCEHYLTNVAMNRIAWLGQAAACYASGIPSAFRGGFYLLTEQEQQEANSAALVALNKWLLANSRPIVSMDEAWSSRQSDIY